MSARGIQPSGYGEDARDRTGKSFTKYSTLTNRELEILQLCSDGLSAEEVAEELNLAGETIKGYKKRIILKMNARNTTHAVAIAIKCDLI